MGLGYAAIPAAGATLAALGLAIAWLGAARTGAED